MTAAPVTTCYRHPDRETGRHCTRCGKPACSDCLRQAAVGAHCVDCVKAAQPATSEQVRRMFKSQDLIATKAIIAINVVAFFAIAAIDGVVTGKGQTSYDLALHAPSVANGEWWRIVSSSVVHYGAIHLFFNMLVLWLVGKVLEPGAGAFRFMLIYIVSVIGGAVGALVLSHGPQQFTGGASGGVFGVAAAATLVLWRQGVRFWDTGFGPLLAINLLLNVTIMTGVSVGGHLGGLIAGAAAAEIMMQARKIQKPNLGLAGAAGLGVALFLSSLLLAAALTPAYLLR
jgi:membrane associated rhomboid family serine protease